MMSKMISRRVFLKATGLAVLSATAAGALAVAVVSLVASIRTPRKEENQ